jgi:YVTN family beta-propeller protein
MPDGTRAFVAGMGANNVVAVSPTGARLGLITVGAGPTGLVISPDGSALYVLNRFEASVSVVSTTTNTETMRVSFFDPTPDEIVAGRPFLYDTQFTSGLGHVSCASCHVDARSDRLAWDLGDPAGAMISFNATCVDNTNCIDWHPMKGPIVTQTLQGIIGQEPFHWRGEKTGLEDFNAAYTNLQGRSAVLTTEEMATLKSYVATLTFGPQPNRNIDGTLRTSLPIFGGVVVGTGGTGNPSAGATVFSSLVTLPNGPGGNSRCVDCHAGLAGTSNEIGIPLGPVAQNRKIAYLRDVYHKTGANLASTTALRGFGFNADSEFQTLQDLLSVGFTFGTGTTAVTRRRDLEAFMLSFGTDTHAGVGQQELAANGGGAGDNVARINQFITIANSGSVGLVVKGRSAGIDRGWVLDAGVFLSDREAEAALSPATLLAMSASGNEIVYTLVPAGTHRRIGIDRDEDGLLDRDELDAGSNPSDPHSPYSSFCSGDGSGTACPCGNAGAAGQGCANSINPSGARLSAVGGSSIATDSMQLRGSGMPNAAALYFQGTAQSSGGLGSTFGDGLRCAAGTIVRLGTKTNAAGTSRYPETGDASISVRGLVTTPGTRTYQVWYRNSASFCTPATFNLSNGVQIAWGL